MDTLKDKIALITGGNAGIGLATARLFRDEGATVLVTARSAETFAKAQRQLGEQFRIYQADVSKVTEIKSLMEKIRVDFGHLDIAFLNAGISQIRPIGAFDETTYDTLFDTNVKGVFYAVQQAEGLLREGGSVIINASLSSAIGFPGGSVYGATKGAVLALTRHFAAEFATRKVRFNSISPGLIDTGIAEKLGMDADSLKSLQAASARNPVGRIGTPEEVAETVLFLASEKSRYINGTDIMIDGGGFAVPVLF